MSKQPDDPMRKSTREKIIDEAQVECHSARSDVVEARLKLNSVPRPVREGFQRTVLSYYDALRPLRTEGVVNSWWESVTLSEDWIEGIVFETESGEQISVSREKARRILNNDEPYEFVGSMVHQGLDTLESLDDATEETTSVVTGMRGRREETTTRPVVLEAGVLVDISRVLDEAATKLGFAPDIDLQDAEAGVV